jgi:hypothetical protein
VVGVIGLIGVPLSAQVTGAVQRGTERRRVQAQHEGEALGGMLRSWIVMDQVRGAGEESDAYKAALCDWLTALAEMAAYGGAEAAMYLAGFVRQGADASTAVGRALLVEAIYAVRRGTLHRRAPRADRESIAMLLFGREGSIQ